MLYLLRAMAALALCLGVLSCDTTKLSDLGKEEFGLIGKAENSNYSARLQYRPLYTMYLAQRGELPDDIEREDVAQEMGNFLNFNLQLNRKVMSDSEQGISGLDLQQNLVLHYGEQRIACAFAQAEILGGQSRYVLSFPSPVAYGDGLSENLYVEADIESEGLKFYLDKHQINAAEDLIGHFKN